jgi:dTDP-4-dehydrorhamnose 3,5-epimerase
METVATALPGCVELRQHVAADRRGSFRKVFQSSAFRDAGFELEVAEIFLSRSRAGVVRGLHFQRPPADVAKLVWCVEGSVVDAVVDLRTDSPTYGRHVTVALGEANAVFVPLGCAHGFYVPEGEAVVAYAQSGEHDAELEGGILWSSADIDWPIGSEPVLSDRDAEFVALADFDSPFRL